MSWHQLTVDVVQVPPSRLAAGAGADVRSTTPSSPATTSSRSPTSASGCRRRRSPFASFLSYAVSNNVGFAMLSGASVRYRFYTRWGLTGEELSRIVFSYSVTFWLGLLALGGLSLAVSPVPALARVSRARRGACGLAAGRRPRSAYVGGRGRGRRAFRIGRYSFPLPTLPIAVDAARAVGGRLGAGRRRALRAAAAGRGAVPRVPRRVPGAPSCSAWPATCRAGWACSKGCWCCC